MVLQYDSEGVRADYIARKRQRTRRDEPDCSARRGVFVVFYVQCNLLVLLRNHIAGPLAVAIGHHFAIRTELNIFGQRTIVARAIEANLRVRNWTPLLI